MTTQACPLPLNHFKDQLRSTDDDPARVNTRRDLKKHLQLLDVKKKLAEQSQADLELTSSSLDYPRAAWMNLGALNANRIETFHPKFIRSYIDATSNFGFEEAYPIFAWMIENSVKRFSRINTSKNHLINLYENTLLGAELAWRIASRSSDQLNRLKSQSFRRVTDGDPKVFRAGDREEVIRFIKEWFDKEVVEYLKICDPYFGVDDLEVLTLLRSVKPDCRVFILTSKKQQDKLTLPWNDAYSTHWRLKISDQDPPDTEIVIVGTEPNGDSPIHDRWLITKGRGLRIGTSFNSLENEVDQYLQPPGRKDYGGKKLKYLRFNL